LFEILFFTRDETLVSVVYTKKKVATRKTRDIKKKPRECHYKNKNLKRVRRKKEKNNRSRGKSGIALSTLCRHPPHQPSKATIQVFVRYCRRCLRLFYPPIVRQQQQIVN
jgi:hypothetical protein